MKRVGYIVKVLFIASVYRHLTAFHIPYMQYLQSKGYEVWAAGSMDIKIKQDLIDHGFVCVDISFSRSPLNKGNVKAYRELEKLFTERGFELVHVHTPVAALLTRMAFRHSKSGEIMYTAHGFHFYKGAPLLNWLIYYPLERLAKRWTDVLITINNEDHERALKMGFTEGSVRYVHGVGVEPANMEMTEEEKESLKSSLEIADDAVVISYIAEINQNKNHSFLLKNWKEIKKKSPTAVLLLIGDGDMKGELERLTVDKQLKDIQLLGFRNDVNELLQITDIVSLLSHREGLPKSIMEAMAASIPCVVSDTRGLRDLISNDRSGYVVPHGDDISLVESLVSLLNDKEKRGRMGAAAFQEVEPYRLENVLQEYITIYDDVLRKG